MLKTRQNESNIRFQQEADQFQQMMSPNATKTIQKRFRGYKVKNDAKKKNKQPQEYKKQ